MWLKHSELNKHEQRLVDMDHDAFQDYMYGRYPTIFANFMRRPEPGEPLSPAAFGIETPRGWNHILDSLCRRLELICTLTGVTVAFTQVKSKYGGARFYYATYAGTEDGEDVNTSVSIIEDLIAHYEEYTNYVCGELGTNVRRKLHIGRWIHDCGLEGYIKRNAGPVAANAVAAAKECDSSAELREYVRDDLYDLSDVGLQKVSDIIAAERAANKARIAASQKSE